MIGLLGDVHGKFDEAFKIVSSFPDAVLWLQVGDLGGDDLDYPSDLPSNFHFIQGNHENWKALKKMEEAPRGPFLRNGNVYEFEVNGTALKVAALGGNFSPKWFERQRYEVPASRDRHYVRDEFDAVLGASTGVNILMTHEAPAPYPQNGSKAECGRPEIAELAVKLNPMLHVFGHHHYYGVYDYNGIKTIGLGYGWSHAVLWDEKTGNFEWVKAP